MLLRNYGIPCHQILDLFHVSALSKTKWKLISYYHRSPYTDRPALDIGPALFVSRFLLGLCITCMVFWLSEQLVVAYSAWDVTDRQPSVEEPDVDRILIDWALFSELKHFPPNLLERCSMNLNVNSNFAWALFSELSAGIYCKEFSSESS